MGRLPADREIYSINRVTLKGQLQVPIRLMERTEWMKETVVERADVEVLVALMDSHTLRLEPPDSPLKEGFDPKNERFGASRFVEGKLSYRRKVGDSPERYSLTLPADQRQWLALPGNHYEVCVTLEAGSIEIWSMDRARRELRSLSEL